MIKKQQKWIALLVAITFMWLLQVSTMPLPAANAPEQIGSANNEQGPRFIEEEGGGGYRAPKKSILPVILIGVGVAAVAAVLFLVVLKTKYDIVGTWIESNTIWTLGDTTIVFSEDGTLALPDFLDVGTYTVDGKTVHFEFKAAGTTYNWVYDGKFDSKDKMSGAVKFYQNSVVSSQGTWTATRVATTAAHAKPLSAEAKKARK